MHIPMDDIVLVQGCESARNPPDDIKQVLFGELSLAERLPRLVIELVTWPFILWAVGHTVDGGLGLNKDKLVFDIPPVINLNEIVVLDLTQSLDEVNGLASLLLVERGDVDANDHEGPWLLRVVGLVVAYDGDLAIALLIIEVFNNV
jgi:hypothetical protein